MEALVFNEIRNFADWRAVMGALEVVGTVYIVLMVLELIFDFATKRRKNFWEPAANVSFYFVTLFFERGIYGLVLFLVFIYLAKFSLVSIPVTLLSWLVCLIATDFLYYVMHRCEHKIRILWTMHSVHHSSEEYDLTTAMRLFWWLDLVIWIFFAPLILIGFEVAQVVACMVIVFTYMTWIHTEKIGKLGWFDKFFSSPSNHRVHHGKNRQYIDKNFGGIFMIWDRLLGTYEPEDERVRYGITSPVGTSNPVKINFHEFVSLYKDLAKAKHWSLWFKYCFYRPGWKPKSSQSVVGQAQETINPASK